jgi:hypothetical protein
MISEGVPQREQMNVTRNACSFCHPNDRAPDA